jgi:hypothetical protein
LLCRWQTHLNPAYVRSSEQEFSEWEIAVMILVSVLMLVTCTMMLQQVQEQVRNPAGVAVVLHYLVHKSTTAAIMPTDMPLHCKHILLICFH